VATSKQTNTRRHHFIPCKWVAFWNSDYYASFLNGEGNKARVRPIHALSFASLKVIKAIPDTLFYSKDLAFAWIDENEIHQLLNVLGFQKFSDKLIASGHILDKIDYNLEPGYSILESELYNCIYTVIRTNKILDEEHLFELSLTAFHHQLRTPYLINTIEQKASHQPNARFRGILGYHKIAQSKTAFLEVVIPLLKSTWVLHIMSAPTFPLSDMPIKYSEDPVKVLFVLSPLHMFEIIPAQEFSFESRVDSLSDVKLDEIMNAR
jgi:hypothetical protein